MTPGKRPYICYRGKKCRDREHRLENTYGEGDCVRVVNTKQEELVTDAEQEKPVTDAEQGKPVLGSELGIQMADEDGKRFADQLLKSV